MKTILLTLTLMLSVLAAQAQVAKPALKVGDKAPEFSLLNGDSKMISLSEYTARGPVVIVFYRGFW